MKWNKTESGSALERSAKLPDEIINAEQSRSDMLKWKLLLVAGLGAVGIGWGEKARPAPLVLALIPFVCLYVDLLCANLNLRTIIIGTFYAESRRDAYEQFVRQHRHKLGMEDWAVFFSTMFLSLMVMLIGLAFWNASPRPEVFRLVPVPPEAPASFALTPGQARILTAAGLAGFGFAFLLRRKCRRDEKLSISRNGAMGNRSDIADLLHPHYSAKGLTALQFFLAQKGCFIFPSLANGLFPAATSAGPGDDSGYQNIWVRDNVHVAHAHWVGGDVKTASRNATTLMKFFQESSDRFRHVIREPKLKFNPMNRPHIRFCGENLTELTEPWGHAQNDALGYFLWFYCKLARQGHVGCGDAELECLAQFLSYFQAIEYWQDQDSGHWEEAQKVSASSIGTVVAGLREFEYLATEQQLWPQQILTKRALTAGAVKHLRERGQAALADILPCESIAPPPHYRRYDGALLFLIYPLEVLPWEQAATILDDVQTHLQGDYGIRRYLGDSYWCPDYKMKLSKKWRTADVSKNMQARDAHAQLGKEAQWCIFDPIVSVIYGQRYLSLMKEGKQEQAEALLGLQTHYLNRALSQLTDAEHNGSAFRSPEAYYVEKGRYVPNDNTPLLWAQANLWLAVKQMQISLAARPPATNVEQAGGALPPTPSAPEI